MMNSLLLFLAIGDLLAIALAATVCYRLFHDTTLVRRWLLLTVVTALVVCSWLVAAWRNEELDTLRREQLLDQAIAIAATVTPQQVSSLGFSAADRDNPTYQRLCRQLRDYGRFAGYRSLYSVKELGGVLRFGPESLPVDDPLASPPGTVYLSPPEELRAVLRDRRPRTVGPFSDEYGTFVSAFAPIVDPRDGQIAMVIGIDIPANEWARAVIWQCAIPQVSGLILAGLLLGGIHGIRWRQRQSPDRQERLRHIEQVVTLGFCLILTLTAGYLTYRGEAASRQRIQTRLAGDQVESVYDGMRLLREQLFGLARVMTLPAIDERRFADYARPMLDNAAILAFGWAPRLPAPSAAAPQAFKAPIRYLEPALLGAVNLDLAGRPNQRLALEDAAHGRLPRAAAPERLFRDDEPETVVYVPVVAAESDEIAGYVFAVVKPWQFMIHGQGSLEAEHLRVELVRLGEEGADSTPGRAAGQSCYPLFIFGETLAVVVTPLPGFFTGTPYRATPIIVVAGLLISLILFVTVGFLSRRNRQLERDIQARTARLNDFTFELANKNDELELARRRAEDANRIKSLFLATVSHDIRTPLNGVIGITDLLLGMRLDPQQRRFAELLRSSGQSLLSLINDLLDLSKIEAGKLQLDEAPFSLHGLIEDLAELLAVGAHEKGVAFYYDLDPALPELLIGDAGRIRQILTNLGGNAVKFTSAGTVAIGVTVAAADAPGVTLRFTVSDTGIGIDEAVLPRLFTPYTQADVTIGGRFGGTGLGLAICRQLVEMMGGTIGVESRPRHGSTFWFTIATRAVAPTLPVVEKPRPKLLLAGGEERFREIYSRLLDLWGYAVTTVTTGDEALAELCAAAGEGEPYAAALFPRALGDERGLELAQRLREERALAATRLVLLIPLGEQVAAQHLAGQGVDAVLTLPLRRNSVGEALSSGEDLYAAERKPAPPPRPVGPATIVVADDNRINQVLIETILRRAGYRVLVVSNGEDVLATLRRERCDLVLMDCHMPILDGIETTIIIRGTADGSLDPEIPIVSITANDMVEDREICLASGMTDFMAKPIDAGQLLSLVNRILEERATQ